jgi:NADH-quinone oxidoreductase subunit C
MLDNDIIIQQLQAKFPGIILSTEMQYDVLNITIQKDSILKVMNFLVAEKDLGFTFLTDLTAVHYPDKKGEELCVIYFLQNIYARVRIRLKCNLDINKPDIFTATSIFSTANWLEREAYDFYGVNFIGHPNLIRIMNVDEMDYFPLRKEYPLEDQSRIDKDDEMFGRDRIMGSSAKQS